MKSIEISPVNSECGENDIELKAGELRKNLRVYNSIQKTLIEKYVSEHKDDERRMSAVEWVDTYSPEYEAAFLDVTKRLLEKHKDVDAILAYKEPVAVNEISRRVDIYHQVEVDLINHLGSNDDGQGKIPNSFIDWHKEFGKDLIQILHDRPDLLEDYLEAQDQHESVEEGVIREIEDILYTR